VGIEIIEQQMHVPACNALTDGGGLGDRVIAAIGLSDTTRLRAAASE
jgi:hypothetical protein